MSLPSVPLALRPAFVENAVAMSKALAIEALRQIMENDERFGEADIEGTVQRLETVFVSNQRRKATAPPAAAITQHGESSSSNVVAVASVPAAPAVREPKPIALPFTGVQNMNNCCALDCLEYIYTQCPKPKKDHGYCDGCYLAMQKAGSNVPKYGTIQMRLAVGLMDYVDPRGKKVRPYSGYMHRKGLTKEEVLAEANRRGVVLEDRHFGIRAPGDSGKKRRSTSSRGGENASSRVQKKSSRRDREGEEQVDFAGDSSAGESDNDEEYPDDSDGSDEEVPVVVKKSTVVLPNKGRKRTIPKSKPFKEGPAAKRAKSSPLTEEVSRQIVAEMMRMHREVNFNRPREDVEDSQAIGSQLEVFDEIEDDEAAAAKLRSLSRASRKELGSRPREDRPVEKNRAKSPAAQAKAVQRELAKHQKSKKTAVDEEAEEAEEDEEQSSEDSEEDEESASESDSGDEETLEESQEVLPAKPVPAQTARVSAKGTKVVPKKNSEVVSHANSHKKKVVVTHRPGTGNTNIQTKKAVVMHKKSVAVSRVPCLADNIFDTSDEEDGDGRQPDDVDDDETCVEDAVPTQKQRGTSKAQSLSRTGAKVTVSPKDVSVQTKHWMGVDYIYDPVTGALYDKGQHSKGITELVGYFNTALNTPIWKQPDEEEDEEEEESEEPQWESIAKVPVR